jgi:hypothetical protein
MTRNLKALLVSAMAVLAMGAVGAQGAQGALFHSEINNPTLTVKTDGALNSKTAHQVFDVAGATWTCAGVTGDGVPVGPVGGTSTSLTLDVAYDSPCTYIGQELNIQMRGCDYTITSHGTFSFTNSTGKSCATEPIVVSVPSPPCTITMGNAGGVNQNLHSIKFHNLNPGGGVNREITLETAVTGVTYHATGSGCPLTGTRSDGSFTTGNAIVTAENPVGGSMVGIWWE